MRIAQLLVLFSFPLFLIAQPAPDFTVTDSNDNIRQLYPDYLNQGKTVLIKFFFTYCPPCNATAPQLVPFYEEWGEGNGDVEFISLSIFASDPNSAVTSYKNQYNHNWPGAGGDGGSADAAMPYIDGTWGNFLGTPAFAVIAPDGSVQFDPKGSNFGATLDSIETALLSTGARKALSDIEITGNIEGINETNVSGQIVGIQNEADSLGMTDGLGDFSVMDTLQIFDQQELVIQVADTAKSAVSVLDVILIQRHILSITPFDNPFKLLAADVDRSGDVSAADLVQILRYIRTQDSLLDDINPWVFLESNFEFQTPNAPALEVFENGTPKIFFKPADNEPMQLTGVRIGDVDGSANQ